MRDVYELVVEHPFFAGIGTRKLERVSLWACRALFHAGDRIFRAGERADKFWLIREGHVDIDTEVPDRKVLVIETLGPGAPLGWSALFPPHRWRFGARAADTTLAVAFDASAIRDMCAEDPALGYTLAMRFTEVVVERLQATRQRLVTECSRQAEISA